jgi:transposase
MLGPTLARRSASSVAWNAKFHFFAFDLPHSDASFVVGYPAETTEAFCDGHVKTFAFLGGMPRSIFDNIKIAVARILGYGKRQRG